jgi:hypothetical protein
LDDVDDDDSLQNDEWKFTAKLMPRTMQKINMDGESKSNR